MPKPTTVTFADSWVVVGGARMGLSGLPGGILAVGVQQAPVEARSFLIRSVLRVAVAKDEVAAILVQVVVMFPRNAVPFAGGRSSPGVPLTVRAGCKIDSFRF